MDEEGAISRSLLSGKRLNGVGQNSAATSENSSPFTFMLIFSSLIIVCGYYILGNTMGYTSPAESGILDELGLSLPAYSLFGSATTIGGIVGASICGKVADFAGRRGAIWVSDTFCIIGWLAIALSKGAQSLVLGRILMGVGVGILAYVVPIYIAEITPKNSRGAFVSLITIMASCGISITYIIGSVCHWRILALVGIIPCLIQFLGAFFIPESPRWLAKVDRIQDMAVALKCLRGNNADVSHEADEITHYIQSYLNDKAEDGIKELFQKKYARAVMIGVGLMALLQFGGFNGYTLYLSSILESAGISSSVGSLAASIIQIVMNFCTLFSIDKFGRQPLLVVSSTGMCFGSFLTGLSFLLQASNVGKEITPVMALIGILVFIAFFAIGVGGIPWIMVAEIFPVNIKSSAGSLVNVVSSVGSFTVAYTFNFLFQWSSSGVFFIYAIISGFGVVFVGKLVPETKGRTLEEIQASIVTK